MTIGDHGTIERDGDDRVVIRFHRRMAAPIERVWKALTEPAELGVWMAPSAVDLRQGGEITHRFGDTPDEVVHGRILHVDPPAVLEYEWRFPGETAAVVRYELVADGEETRLTVIHRRLGAGQWLYAPGWHAYLDRLSAQVTGGSLPAWDERFAEVRPSYAAP